MPKSRQKHKKHKLIKKMTLRALPAELLKHERFQDILKELLKGNAGIYALYNDDELYYVGLTQDLYKRMNKHMRDRHAGKWNKFRIFIISKLNYLRELETLIIRIANPQGNKLAGKIKKEDRLELIIKKRLKDEKQILERLEKEIK